MGLEWGTSSALDSVAGAGHQGRVRNSPASHPAACRHLDNGRQMVSLTLQHPDCSMQHAGDTEDDAMEDLVM